MVGHVTLQTQKGMLSFKELSSCWENVAGYGGADSPADGGGLGQCITWIYNAQLGECKLLSHVQLFATP